MRHVIVDVDLRVVVRQVHLVRRVDPRRGLLLQTRRGLSVCLSVPRVDPRRGLLLQTRRGLSVRFVARVDPSFQFHRAQLVVERVEGHVESVFVSWRQH